MIDIGYIRWFEKNDYYSRSDPEKNDSWMNLLNYDLEKLDTWKNSTSNFTKCPAFITYIDNVWMIKSPIDINLKWENHKKKIVSDLSPIAHDMLIKTHSADFNPYTSFPIVALNTGFVFLADDDVWIDFIPAFNHTDPGWRLIPGTFNIKNWQRPVVPTIEMLQNEIKIQRGQPLAYVKFRSSDLRDKFKLIKQEQTPEIENIVMSCISVKFFQRNISWKFITGLLPNQFRPKKLLRK